jgi:CheY-like chemotaxis protein
MNKIDEVPLAWRGNDSLASLLRVTRREVRILLANSESMLNCVFKAFFGALLPPGTPVRFNCTGNVAGFRRQLRSGEFDLCILILNNLLAKESPGKDRIEQTIDALAEAKRSCPTPIVVYSGYCPDAAFARRVRRAGADHFGLLPFTVPQLRAAICRAWSRRKSGRKPFGRTRR